MTNIKQKAREMFDAEKWTHWHTRCSQFVEIPNSLKDKFKEFMDQIIDLAREQTLEEANKENHLLWLAHEELLELRGFLTEKGGFNPDYDKLEKYWNSGKPEWEKNLQALKSK